MPEYSCTELSNLCRTQLKESDERHGVSRDNNNKRDTKAKGGISKLDHITPVAWAFEVGGSGMFPGIKWM